MSRLRHSLREIQSIIGYRFKDGQILQEALLVDGRQTTVLANDVIPSRKNRDLALIGDSVLKLIFVQAGYQAQLRRGMSSMGCFN